MSNLLQPANYLSEKELSAANRMHRKRYKMLFALSLNTNIERVAFMVAKADHCLNRLDNKNPDVNHARSLLEEVLNIITTDYFS